MGAKNRPYFRIVVSDSLRTPRGAFNENLGHYDPRRNPVDLRVDVARAEEWIRKGAQPSETVSSLLDKARATSA
jgi:small subunit ribosomal protein S16